MFLVHDLLAAMGSVNRWFVGVVLLLPGWGTGGCGDRLYHSRFTAILLARQRSPDRAKLGSWGIELWPAQDLPGWPEDGLIAKVVLEP